MSENLLKPIDNTSEKQKTLTNGAKSIFISSHTSKISQKSTSDGLPNLTPLFEIWDSASKDILERKSTPQNTIGLYSIDNILWGFRKKILYTIGARTSHGKTSFAINMVTKMVGENKRIIYFTMETSKEQILEKIFCNFCNVNSLDLLHGKATQKFNDNKNTFKTWIDHAHLLIDDKYGYDFPSMLKLIDIINPDFIFVDYVQMISTKGYRSKLDAIEEYVRKIAELAITKNFGAILISQINRSGVDDPSMSKFKHAGVLEEHSRVAIILSYDKNSMKYKVNVEKNSFGQTGEFYIKFEPEYSRFRDLTKKEIEEMEAQKRSKNIKGGLHGYQ